MEFELQFLEFEEAKSAFLGRVAPRELGRKSMRRMASIRIFSLVMLALLPPCSAICSPLQDLLPDAPSATVDHSPSLRAMVDTARLPVATLPDNRVLQMKYDPLHLDTETQPKHASPAAFLPQSQWKRSPVPESSGVFGRAANAAADVILPRDGDGSRKLNTQYLLRVLTVATAHVGETPYWRRSPSQPVSDFGSMLGNDAGMNVFHVFQPGLMQLVKNREPRFVTRFQQYTSRKSN